MSLRVVKIFVHFCGVDHVLGGYDMDRLFKQNENNIEAGQEPRGEYDAFHGGYKGTDNNAKTKDTPSCPEKSLTDDTNVEDGDSAAISEEDEVHDADVASVDTINWSNDDIGDLVEFDFAEDASLDLTTSDDSADGDELSDYSSGAEEFIAVDDDEDQSANALDIMGTEVRHRLYRGHPEASDQTISSHETKQYQPSLKKVRRVHGMLTRASTQTQQPASAGSKM
ncbi:hypothetical protein OWV82_016504 [Melia azedarach]|uniref:Uncharacterized protein n=1 Tax=Melia azedarach TaxID=155640 RepID=A0ACC1XGP2_MELAZ|nr:hypothetical protein OWV82_016504 [Melia azedarach]